MEDKKENILKSATDIFSKFGFYGTKMEDIAKKAGIGKGTIYGYFDSKESLFYEMIKYGIDEYGKGLDIALNIEGNLKEKLYALCQFHEKYLNKYMDISQVIRTEKGALPKELTTELLKRKASMFTMIKNVIEKSIEKGELRKDLDEELAATIIVGSISQFYTFKLVYFKKQDKELLLSKLVETILRGLK